MTRPGAGAWAREHLSRERLTVAGTVLVVAAGGAAVVWTVDVDAVVAAVAGADPAFLTAAIAAYLFSWPVRGRRYGDVLAAMGRRCRSRFLLAVVFVSQTANLVVPARGGDGVRAYLLKDRRGVPYPTGIASLAVERAFDLVAIATLGGIGAAVLFGSDRPAAVGGPTVAVTAAVALGAVAFLFSAATIAVARSDRQPGLAIRDRVAGSGPSWLGRGVDAVVRFGAAVRVVAVAPRSLVRIYLGSLVVWAFDVLTAVAVLAALLGGVSAGRVPATTLLAVGALAVSVGNLAKVLPLSQGGVGLYEAAFTGIVVAITPIPAGTAVAAAILDHAIKNAVTLGGGAVAGASLNASPTTASADAEAPNA
ncbi:MAG: hypothetical protein A07HR67_00412 [uncultured archaeon A07HR67]|nr:MAG: hypothetical protein A07HR67_00412 [uncultured archaeon A07HR67]